MPERMKRKQKILFFGNNSNITLNVKLMITLMIICLLFPVFGSLGKGA